MKIANEELQNVEQWLYIIICFFLYLYIKVNENKYRVSSHMNCKKCIHKVREKYKNEYIYIPVCTVKNRSRTF